MSAGTEAVGIAAYGVYVPRNRLARKAVADVLGTRAGRGTRSVASFDEDATSLAVEAGRSVLRELTSAMPSTIYFATTNPPYLDKTNATAIHAALGLPNDALAVDMHGSVRSGVGAIRAALDATGPALAILSDVRTGLPGSRDELDAGDGAVALLMDRGPDVLAHVVGTATATVELLERWRCPGDVHSSQWEERFAEHAWAPLVDDVVEQLYTLVPNGRAVDRAVISGTNTRVVRRAVGDFRGADVEVADDLGDVVGHTGIAQAGIVLCDVLDRAGPDELIAVVSISDGVDGLLLRTTPALADRHGRRDDVRAQLETATRPIDYATYLTWRGHLLRESLRRPLPPPPQAPPSFRSVAWKFRFTGSRCDECRAVHLPAERVCVSCGSRDRMSPVPMADARGRVSNLTDDRLGGNDGQVRLVAVVDFEGGGRFQCELADADEGSVQVGDVVRMTFRRLYTSGGIHNYFWKARPESSQDW